ncbi:MAG: class I SAM-dependent methyltransferase [Inquilinus sp.]|uniref:class I SAM-dependent methyltransferase n=1 Tax=Inquilinus sp. TaxID=1932117 RepID=UPI003F314E74
MPDDVPYILGHSQAELRRLMLQASILQPITRRLLLEAGLRPGMRVLDIGCGTGDVSLLAAELAGLHGSVVGIDRSAEAVATARGRAEAFGLHNVAFREAEAGAFDDPDPFDLAVGRYVLIHQADPAALLRAVTARVRPGGTVAFHEIVLYGESPTWPPVPLVTEVWDGVMAAFASVLPHRDVASRLVEHFHRAGLGNPSLFCETPVGGGPDSPVYAWFVQTLRSLQPQIERIGRPVPADIDTLEDRLRDEAVAAHAQLVGPHQFCAWARVPGQDRGDRLSDCE